MNATTPTIQTHPSAVEVMGRLCLENERGGFDPLAIISPADLLEDELVRKLLGFAKPLSAELARLKAYSFADVEAFLGLLAQDYTVERRTRKGNLTLYTYDRRLKVEVKSSDRIVFGPQLQMAKAKVDECLRKWGGNVDPRLQAIINSAFDVDREGDVRPARILLLRRAHITDDPDWDQAMRAIDDAMRVVGTSFYMLFRERERDTDKWNRISLDFANVELTPEAEAAFSPRRELAKTEDIFDEIRAQLDRYSGNPGETIADAVSYLVDQLWATRGELELLAAAPTIDAELRVFVSAAVAGRANMCDLPIIKRLAAIRCLASLAKDVLTDLYAGNGIDAIVAQSHQDALVDAADSLRDAIINIATIIAEVAPGESGEVIAAAPASALVGEG